MRKLKIVVSFFLLMIAMASQAQTPGAGKKKKKTTVVKAHRGTVVLNIHEKVNHLAQTRYAALPRLGSLITALPPGATVVTKDSVSFFYKNGFFYSTVKTGYQMVLPVAGLRIQGLPIGYRRVPVGEKLYFYFYGVFYAQAGGSDHYDVITAPEGAVVDAIPDGYKVQKIENVEYYLLGDVYYAEVDAPKIEGNTGYEVVTIIQTYEIF